MKSFIRDKDGTVIEWPENEPPETIMITCESLEQAIEAFRLLDEKFENGGLINALMGIPFEQ